MGIAAKVSLMLALLTLSLSLLVAQADPPAVKLSLFIDAAKPVADGRTLVIVTATVTDAKGRPVPNAGVRFGAHGYGIAPDGEVVGSYEDMKRGVDYRVVVGGGLLSGNPKQGPSNQVTKSTNEKGVARVFYKPFRWADFMNKVPTRLTARVDGAPVAVLDIFFAKPEK
jgi:hypothetical protein